MKKGVEKTGDVSSGRSLFFKVSFLVSFFHG